MNEIADERGKIIINDKWEKRERRVENEYHRIKDQSINDK